MTSMRQVSCSLPWPSAIQCACSMFFCVRSAYMFSIFVAPIGRPHDAHDADDAVFLGGCWVIKRRCEPQQNAQSARSGQCLWFNAVFDAFLGVLTPPGLNEAKIGSQLC